MSLNTGDILALTFGITATATTLIAAIVRVWIYRRNTDLQSMSWNPDIRFFFTCNQISYSLANVNCGYQDSPPDIYMTAQISSFTTSTPRMKKHTKVERADET